MGLYPSPSIHLNELIHSLVGGGKTPVMSEGGGGGGGAGGGGLGIAGGRRVDGGGVGVNENGIDGKGVGGVGGGGGEYENGIVLGEEEVIVVDELPPDEGGFGIQFPLE